MGSVDKDNCGGIYPSNLHLKKELTQIRKAARVLRDPGTSCTSLKHTPFSSRTLFEQRCNDDNVADEKGHLTVREKDKRVFLCNWERDLRGKQNDGEINKVLSGCDEEMDGDSLSDARYGGGNECKSDTWFSEKYTSMILKCREANFTPSVRRTIKKKPRRSCSGVRVKHQNVKNEKRKVWSTYGKRNADSLSGVTGLPGDDFSNLVSQLGDTEEEYEDVKRESATSPFLAGFKNTGWKHSSLKFKGRGKDDECFSFSTPALSTSSYHKNAVVNPSVDSWDARTGSLNDADDEVDDQWDFPGRQGCGISCYWSKRSTPKSRPGYGSCCSPSLSEVLKRKGNSMICLKQQHPRKHNCSSLSSTNRRPNSGEMVQSLVPLLSNGNNRRRVLSSDSSDCDSSINLGELRMEAMSQFDGRRLSSACRNQQGSELLALCDQVDDENDENTRSLSHKYRPLLFDELVGQNIVAHSLRTAVSRGRIAPVYLFHGPRGTGKSSTARIFAAALNCLAIEETKPCGVCRACNNFVSGKSNYLLEVDGCNRKGISNMRNHLKTLLAAHPSAFKDFKVFVIEECHLLPSKAWFSFLRFLDKPLPHIVFIFITTDADNIPHSILSRCQRHLFSKIATGEIVDRLMKISASENLDIESDALELIASNADGSLRDAETMLDQLSLLGKRITIPLVNDLMGGVSDEKLLELLELAMSSNTTETVIRARELLDSGVDPIILMSQMATLIVDMIAGTHSGTGSKFDSSSNGQNLTEREVTRLKHALAILSDAEKHLRVSAERSTWFKATLLHLGSLPASDRSHSGSGRRPSSKIIGEDRSCMLGQGTPLNRRSDGHLLTGNPASPLPTSAPRISTGIDGSKIECFEAAVARRPAFKCMDSKMLGNIWSCCIEKCHSNTLKQLLYANGRLVSISEIKGGLLAHIAFSDRNIRTRAEGFISSITNSLEIVLQQNVEVKIILLPESLVMEPSRASTGTSFDPIRNHEPYSRDSRMATPQNNKPEIPRDRIESIITEQRMEATFLQAMEKNTPGSLARVRPERNQVLPQDNEYQPKKELDSMSSDPKWEDELNQEIKALRISNAMVNQKEQVLQRINCRPPKSPCLLHNSSLMSNFSLDTMGYESGTAKPPGCGGIFCWSKRRAQGRVKGKSKSSQLSCFGECGKAGKDRKQNR